jgi:hypothetical protein
MAARRLRLRRRLSDQAILICRGLMSPRATRAPESKKKPLAQKTLDVKVLVQICTARLSLTASPYRHDLRVAGDI